MSETETIQIYVKPSANSDGMPLQTFELLSPTWTGIFLFLKLGVPPTEQVIVGWSDSDNPHGMECWINVAKVRGAQSGKNGYMVWGGNLGVRVMDGSAPEINPYWPLGYGWPILWVDEQDLPVNVRQVIHP